MSPTYDAGPNATGNRHVRVKTGKLQGYRTLLEKQGYEEIERRVWDAWVDDESAAPPPPNTHLIYDNGTTSDTIFITIEV